MTQWLKKCLVLLVFLVVPQAKILFGIDGIIQVLYHCIIGIIGNIGYWALQNPQKALKYTEEGLFDIQFVGDKSEFQ